MMNGYDKAAAVSYIAAHVDKKEHKALLDQLFVLLDEIIDADMAYMHETGVLDADGNAGDEYYDDDEALEFILETLMERHAYTPEQELQVGQLIGDYIELQQDFLESAGLVEWE